MLSEVCRGHGVIVCVWPGQSRVWGQWGLNGQNRGDAVLDRTPETVSEEFTLDGLSRVRMLTNRACERAGVARDFVAAVNEIAINVIRHAGGRGRFRLSATGRRVAVEIADNGPGLGRVVTDRLPDVGAFGGRGLWLARRLCPAITFTSSAHGLTVRLVAGDL